MPSYAEVMDPGDDDGQGISKSVGQAVAELVALGPSQPLPPVDYIAKLFCGHVVNGTTRAKEIRFGSHGAPCGECGEFQLFADIVLKRDLVV